MENERPLEIGKKLKKRRSELNLTLSELSKQSGLALQLISDYENERKEPGLKNLIKLSEALKVHTSYFLEYDPFGNSKKSTVGYALQCYVTALGLLKEDKVVIDGDNVVIQLNNEEIKKVFTDIKNHSNGNEELKNIIQKMAINMLSNVEIEDIDK